MNRPQSLIHIVAPNPDGRKKEMLIATCTRTEDVQDKVVQLGLDIDSIRVFSGFELPVLKQVRVMLGDPRPRRGRPPGSKNKPKRKVKAAAKNTVAARVKRKGPKRAKAQATEAHAAPARRGKRAGETQADRNQRVEASA